MTTTAACAERRNKILILTFKAIHGLAPDYINLIRIRNIERYGLRSRNGITLNCSSVKLKKTLGDRAFLSAAPTLCKKLSLHIRNTDNFIILELVIRLAFFDYLLTYHLITNYLNFHVVY